MDMKSQLPVIARYLIAIIAAALAGRGLIPADQVAAFIDSAVAVVLAIVAFVPLVWALIRRPSSKALEAAKLIDQRIPKDDTVVIQTPGLQPDIVVPPKS